MQSLLTKREREIFHLLINNY